MLEILPRFTAMICRLLMSSRVAVHARIYLLPDTGQDLPTVDAVHVIRCKDCKYYSCGTIEGKHLCMSVKYRFTPTTEDEWCSRAEEKEE